MPTDLFAQVQSVLNVAPDQRGYVHTACPACGREHKHFAVFVKDGRLRGNCVACGHWMGQKAIIASYLGDVPQAVLAAPIKARPPTGEPKWKAHADEYQFRFTSAADVIPLWQARKPLPVDLIIQRGYGVGVLPASQCHHRRLTVPLYQNGKVVSWRARRIDCVCPKWLSPLGHPKLLYNGARLLDVADRPKSVSEYVTDTHGALSARGKEVIIQENPVDADWVEFVWGLPAVATLGTGNWRPEWSRLLSVAELAVIAYDNDLPGNGGNTPADYAYLVNEWKVKHNTDKYPAPRGPWLAKQLTGTSVLYKWPAGVKDMGELLCQSCQP